MPLTPGARLGPYEITAALGAGGMGEVYRAKDTRLDRVVAIKVLPAHLSESPELRQRFEREARAISSLSHPHICTLFDVGHQDGIDFLVMEHLEGENLGERLARGPLSPEQVVRYGIEIVDALDKAHRQGIVHRDLKPGNIMLTRSGIKLLDFGLAKMVAGGGGEGAAAALTTLPTEGVGSQPLTTEGTLLGTFQYMAPEQLEGNEADARTDIFALGAVLYEMATGKPAFAGKSRASLISAIMSAEPAPITTTQPLAPPALDRVVRSCLAKDPDERWQTAHDVGLQLRWIAEGGSAAGVPAPIAMRRRSRERVAWVSFAVAAVAVAVLGALLLLRRTEPPAVVKFTVPSSPAMLNVDSPRISPNGRFIAVDAADSSGNNLLWLHAMGSLDFVPIPGTGNSTRPFWSPDSRYIGFVADGKLKKVAVTGGPPQTVCEAPTGSDGSWGTKGVIVFDGRASDPIRRVAAAGGQATTSVKSDSGIVAWPAFLPDGRHFVFVQTGKLVGAGELCVGDIESKQVHHLGIQGSRAEYSRAGYLLFVRDRTLLAQAFDPGALKLRGEPIPVADAVGVVQSGALAHFSVSDNGVLIYSQGGGTRNTLKWVDRAGKVIGSIAHSGDLFNVSLSPDERWIAIREADAQSGNRDIWILDTVRGASTRLTFDPANENVAVWSPDGSHLAFSSNRAASFSLYQKLASGAGEEESLYVSATDKFLTDWSADGKYLCFTDINPTTQADLEILPMTGERKPQVIVRTPFNEGGGRFSPDGRWIAYGSDESGRSEIYVRSLSGLGGKWQVSTAGGNEPFWRHDGKELFFLSPDLRLMSVDVSGGESFTAGVPKALFTMATTGDGFLRYAASRDGSKFLVITPERTNAVAPTTVVLNWNAEIEKK